MRLALMLLALGGLATTACRSPEDDGSNYELSEAQTASFDISGMT